MCTVNMHAMACVVVQTNILKCGLGLIIYGNGSVIVTNSYL